MRARLGADATEAQGTRCRYASSTSNYRQRDADRYATVVPEHSRSRHRELDRSSLSPARLASCLLRQRGRSAFCPHSYARAGHPPRSHQETRGGAPHRTIPTPRLTVCEPRLYLGRPGVGVGLGRGGIGPGGGEPGVGRVGMGSGFFAVVMWRLQGRSRDVDCNQDTVPLRYSAMNDSENDKILSTRLPAQYGYAAEVGENTWGAAHHRASTSNPRVGDRLLPGASASQNLS
jgi:hypothetical protein